MIEGRLTYEEMIKICDSIEPIEPYYPYPNNSHWQRRGESDEYAYESNRWSLDHRIIDKKTGKEVWSYYTDYYTG